MGLKKYWFHKYLFFITRCRRSQRCQRQRREVSEESLENLGGGCSGPGSLTTTKLRFFSHLLSSDLLCVPKKPHAEVQVHNCVSYLKLLWRIFTYCIIGPTEELFREAPFWSLLCIWSKIFCFQSQVVEGGSAPSSFSGWIDETGLCVYVSLYCISLAVYM